MKSVLLAAASLCVALFLAGCGGDGAQTSEQATASNPMILTLSHNQGLTHPVHLAMQRFADDVKERTGGRILVKIFPNAQLGSEVESMEQLMAGVIAMTKLSAPGLATYDESYHAFGLPYVFKDTPDFYRVMDSDAMRKFFLSSEPAGFITLTYYTSGARSFYTVNRAIRKPSDLAGLKIRVQNMKSQIDMMNALGGIPVAMSYGEVYTSLQTGVIDGTENNETALTLGKHGEVCKVYSFDQHAMIPDAMIMSSRVWARLNEADRKAIQEAAWASTAWHSAEWDKAVDAAVEEAKRDMKVEFVYDCDKDAFRSATAGMTEQYSRQYPKVKTLLDLIHSVQEGK